MDHCQTQLYLVIQTMQISFSLEIVANEVTVAMGKASIHFKKVLMMTNDIVLFFSGQAKSIWSRDHGREGHGHG